MGKNNFIAKLIYKVTHCGIAESDSQDTKIEKQIITLLPVIIGIAAIFWGSIYLSLGHYLSASIPLSYSVISAISIWYFANTKRLQFFKDSQLMLVLLLPFLLMWSLGGFASGSYVMIWAFYTPLAAMAYSKKDSFLWLSLFLLLTLLSSLIDPILIEQVRPMPALAINIFSLLNISVGFSGIFYIINYYVKEKNAISDSLIELNDALEYRISEELKLNREKDRIMFEQSRFASMGEMINNIAHQWRQPLNALSLSVQNISFAYETGKLTPQYMERASQKANLLIMNMSTTIDDFRNFFKPNRDKQLFDVTLLVQNLLDLVQASLVNHQIAIQINVEEEFKILGFPNEFLQVLLNLINNSKDALIESKNKSPIIRIRSYRTNVAHCLEIADNAGGIPKDIIDKIFDPYFTTKEEGKGTGIGLYMSKMIVENNMSGKLTVHNTEEGALFTITLPHNN